MTAVPRASCSATSLPLADEPSRGDSALQTRYYHHWLPISLALLTLTSPGKSADNTGITAQQADRIISELTQIRTVLTRSGAGAVPSVVPKGPVKVDLTGVQSFGSADAPVTIVEFTDYQCPYCNRFYTDVFAKVKHEFVDSGKVKFFSRDLPLDIHPNAMQAAQAGRCAAEQGHFWQMRDQMSANPTKLEMIDLMTYAEKSGLDVSTFRACLDSDKYKPLIEQDIATAASIGVTGTPAFVIGKSSSDSVAGELVLGALPYAKAQRRTH